MGRYRADVAVDDTPAGSLDDVWWWCVRDLGSYFHGYGIRSGGVAAVRDEWLRLDGTDLPVVERVEQLVTFCAGFGVEEWALRARTGVCRARAQHLREKPGDTDRRATAAQRRRRLSADEYFQNEGSAR